MAGERQPNNLKVFISYSRADEAFADELKLGLDDKGYTVEIDKQSIRQGEEWKARLAKLIAASDTVIFVLSPDSARSPVCHWEVDEAHRQAKRVVPVLHRGLNEPPKGKQPDGSPWPEGPAKAPERLTLLNYPRFDEGRSFMAGLRGLVQALEDDLEWIEAHSRLANRARDWDEGGRATNRLMSGPDIAAAKRLIETRKMSAPPMLPVQLDFIQASEVHEAAQKNAREQELQEKRRLAEEALAQSRKAERRTRVGLVAVVFLALVASGLGIWADTSRRAALVAQAEADRARALAERRADRLKLSMLEAMTEPTAVQESFEYILAQEITSQDTYERNYSKPSWPGGSSGVTIGVGYDLGVTVSDRFEADWGPALPKETIARLKQAIGVKGSAAKSLVETLKDIEVPFSTARQVFIETTVPRFYHLMTSAFPGASELPFACQGALLSLIYNRGPSLEGERRIHMRGVRDAIVTDKLDDVPFQLRAMKELWAGSGMSGIVKRREGEALMCEKAFRLRERVLQVLARESAR
jgi:hypothetical protein